MNFLYLILAIMVVESNGDNAAIGDNYRAVGAMQIHPIVIRDVNRIYGSSYVLEDRLDREVSFEIAYKYLTYWGSYDKVGRNLSISDYARIWNGGPNGYKKPSTKEYGYRVENIYNVLQKDKTLVQKLLTE